MLKSDEIGANGSRKRVLHAWTLLIGADSSVGQQGPSLYQERNGRNSSY